MDCYIVFYAIILLCLVYFGVSTDYEWSAVGQWMIGISGIVTPQGETTCYFSTDK